MTNLDFNSSIFLNKKSWQSTHSSTSLQHIPLVIFCTLSSVLLYQIVIVCGVAQLSPKVRSIRTRKEPLVSRIGTLLSSAINNIYNTSYTTCFSSCTTLLLCVYENPLGQSMHLHIELLPQSIVYASLPITLSNVDIVLLAPRYPRCNRCRGKHLQLIVGDRLDHKNSS
jgi:hypothetical protein